MTPNRPYLIRAIHEWIVDNGLTPHLIVSAEVDGVQVPKQHVENGRIVLNISPHAVRDLQLGNEWIEFGARFGGNPFKVAVPTQAVLAVYARENGVGMAFEDDDPENEPPSNSRDKKSVKPALRVVK